MSINRSGRVASVALLTGLVLGGINAPAHSATSYPTVHPDAKATPMRGVDYGKKSSWMIIPPKASRRAHSVDMFYLYPTEYRRSADGPVLAPITDPGMRTGAMAAYGRGGSTFSPYTNVYAPWYRQADALVALNLPPAQHRKLVGGVPTHDALRAFKYFLRHFNHKRPFILAGHSQGSEITLNILTRYLGKHPKALKRMVAAYVIGYSVTPKTLKANPHLKFAKNAHDTNVIVSYNTEAPVIGGRDPVVTRGAMAINPITWTRTERKASAAVSKGSWLPDASGVFHKVTNFADAQVSRKRDCIIAAKPDVDVWAPGNVLFPKGVYHSFDYPFYYFNLRANGRARIHAYFHATG